MDRRPATERKERKSCNILHQKQLIYSYNLIIPNDDAIHRTKCSVPWMSLLTMIRYTKNHFVHHLAQKKKKKKKKSCLALRNETRHYLVRRLTSTRIGLMGEFL
jgi:hypothetical protein